MPTPAELLAMCEATIDAEQTWTEALILEKLGFNWGSSSYGGSGEYTINFKQEYDVGDPENDIDIRPKVLAPDGTDIGGEITEVTNTYFKIGIGAAATVDYIAFEAKITVPQ